MSADASTQPAAMRVEEYVDISQQHRDLPAGREAPRYHPGRRPAEARPHRTSAAQPTPGVRCVAWTARPVAPLRSAPSGSGSNRRPPSSRWSGGHLEDESSYAYINMSSSYILMQRVGHEEARRRRGGTFSNLEVADISTHLRTREEAGKAASRCRRRACGVILTGRDRTFRDATRTSTRSLRRPQRGRGPYSGRPALGKPAGLSRAQGGESRCELLGDPLGHALTRQPGVPRHPNREVAVSGSIPHDDLVVAARAGRDQSDRVVDLQRRRSRPHLPSQLC